ncbi:helix-turn-helix transcriptional regulator [Amycolatopsis sp. NPDC005232]|uniref:helix-turn-helix transcriptional regulator n=1 Tax=Amycolatopsis sp. NPDC005232 TaxID=3157027 RepID=UPI0033B4D943
MSDLGRRLKAACEDAGVSLSALAKKTHWSKAQLGHLETGKRHVKREHVLAYARALNVPVDTLYGRRLDPLRVAHEWLVADTPMAAHSTAGRRIGESLVSEIEQRVIDLRHLDDTVGGGDLAPVVHRELSELRNVAHCATYSEEMGRRLLIAVGELSQLVGWVESDAGHYEAAQHVYLDGVSAAHDAGDDVLAGQLLSSLSYQIANVGDPSDGALLAKTAVKGAGGATPVARTLLLERVAWATARSRDVESARRVLDLVDDAFEERSDGIPEPEWVYWMSRDEIDVMAGRCWIEMGQPAKAAPLLRHAIEGYDTDHAREIALYQTWLAESYAKEGQLDEARDVIQRAREASDQINSARLGQRVDEIERLVS